MNREAVLFGPMELKYSSSQVVEINTNLLQALKVIEHKASNSLTMLEGNGL